MQKGYTKTIGTAVLATCLVMGGSALVKAEHVMESGTDVVKVNLYGQVNRAIMAVDDGENSDWFHVDNDNSSSRVGLKGKVNVSDEFSTGVKFEADWQSNASNEVQMEQYGDDHTSTSDGDNFDLRKFELWFDSKKIGKFTLGQGDTASNGTSEMDLSGTSVAGYSDINAFAGDFGFWDDNSSTYTVKIDEVFTQVDGLSRRDRLRYDSPKFAGFTASGSWVERDAWDLALRYDNTFDAFRVMAGIAYSNPGDIGDDFENYINGSFSVLLNMGISLTFAAGQKEYDEIDADDPFFLYGKLGYQTKALTVLGKTAFSIDYNATDDNDEEGDEAEMFGIQAVQKIDNWGAEFFSAYRLYSLDRDDDSDMEDINVFMAGSRIKF
jgi:predicted porin